MTVRCLARVLLLLLLLLELLPGGRPVAWVLLLLLLLLELLPGGRPVAWVLLLLLLLLLLVPLPGSRPAARVIGPSTSSVTVVVFVERQAFPLAQQLLLQRQQELWRQCLRMQEQQKQLPRQQERQRQ